MKQLILLLTILAAGVRLQAQSAANTVFTPTQEQVAAIQKMQLSIVMLMAQAPGNFESLKGTVTEAKDGHTFYNVARPDPGMAGGEEMVSVESGKTHYAAVFFGKTGRDLSFYAFMAMPLFGLADGSLTIREGTPKTGSSDKIFDLLLKGTKVAEYNYDTGIDVGMITIGMF